MIIARYFVARYYEQEIYSPYDYVGAKLGPARPSDNHRAVPLSGRCSAREPGFHHGIRAKRCRRASSHQRDLGTRQLSLAGWTLIGGMVTVIWTDVIQFIVVVIGVHCRAHCIHRLCTGLAGGGGSCGDGDRQSFKSLISASIPPLAIRFGAG